MKKTEVSGRLISFFIGIVATLGAGFLIYKSGVATSILKVAQVTTDSPAKVENTKNWALPKSTKQGYPDWDNGKLSIFDTSNKVLKNTNISVAWGSGEHEKGETTPEPSPDLLYTAYIDTNTQDLWIMSNETLEKTKVPESQNVTYITGWSPDSKVLIYYFAPKSVSSAKEGMIVDFDVAEKFDKNAISGFFALDIKTGAQTRIYPVDNIVAVLSNSEVITRIQEDKLVIFDFESFTADYSSIKGKFGFGPGQFNFSRDGSLWTFIGSNTPTDDMYITKAEFPNKQGTIIDAGGWADVQWPILSPDGKKVAYQRAEFSDKFKSNIAALWIVDDSKIPEKLGMGRPLAWVDNDNLIIDQTVDVAGRMASAKALFSITSKKVITFK
ncbi:hypothetical protein GYA27_01005 [candidate division WWE3 bacterium]|uniref:WD40 repeat domain-containing protein n=1 Tax=candidate division WWE3 bacterium TaxID=2053526 RepID=A0A7X9HGC7_UNCKA|nr:hypothetical protein [candidate division WWE3 bacterium]